ncbi:alpha/beta fold hydrolase [Flavobacteriaceae bacterium 3-367]|uniref:alpha/beta fold hydrolase n=1 Tax=Eudoraea algarum TaxID=3417568 RepID=UPI003291D947
MKKLSNMVKTSVLSIILVIFTVVFISCNSDDDSVNKNRQIAFANYPYLSNFIILESGLEMHYLDEGEGEIPLIMVHGLPTSSYLWRKMIPELSRNNRVIAIDLPNFGKSEKTGGTPCSGEYVEYINEFVEALNLPKVRLLNHDMGGFVGGLFAARYPEKVDAAAMFEVVFSGPFPKDFLPPFLQELRGPNADQLVLEDNFFIETLLLNNDFNGMPDPAFGRTSIVQLNEDEVTEFRSPFLTPESRQALHFDRDCLGILEINDQNRADFIEIAQYFQQTDKPRLVLFGNPSFVLSGDFAPPGAVDPISNLPITMRNVVTGSVSGQVGGWQNIDNVSVYDMIKPSLHYWQNETNGAAEEAAVAISNWLDNL